jgi:hypothetical protein
LDKVRANNLDLSKTLCLGKVTISNVEAEHVWLDGSIFAQDFRIVRLRDRHHGIFLSGIVAVGQLEINDVVGSFDISGGEYQGSFLGLKLNINKFSVTHTVFNARTQFDLRTSEETFIYECKFKSDLVMLGARIGTTTTPADLTIADSDVAGDLDLRDVTVSGRVRLGPSLANKARLDGLTAASGCTIHVDCP